MEQSRKNLKISSIVVLIFAGFSLLQIVAELLFGELNNAAIPEGGPNNVLLITKIFLLAVSVLLLLPSVYVGVKGLKVAKRPDSSKSHIILAVILLVFAALGLVEPAIGFVKQGELTDNLSSLFGALLEVVIYFEYIQYARAVAKKN